MISEGPTYFITTHQTQGASPSQSKAKLYGQSPTVRGAAFQNESKPVLAGVVRGTLTKT